MDKLSNISLKEKLLLFFQKIKGKYLGENLHKTCLENNLYFDCIMIMNSYSPAIKDKTNS